jgi:hypothetical protein
MESTNTHLILGKEKFMNSKLIKITAFIFLVIPMICQAEIIKIGFTGEVDYVWDLDNLLANNVQIGSAMSGFYIYDSETLDSNPDLNIGEYTYSSVPFGISLTTGNILFQTDFANVDFIISIVDGIASGGWGDKYTVGSGNNLFYNNDIYIQTVGLQLIDYSYTAISSTELTSFPPDLSAWQYGVIEVHGGRGGTPPCYEQWFGISGHINSIYLIPEPATLMLLGLGFLFIRKRK